MIRLLLLVITIGCCFRSSCQNVLNNPGFEQEDGAWALWGGERSTEAYSGKYSMSINNSEPKWSGADQKVSLPSLAKRVKVKGYMKTENVVPGQNNWEKARITAEFYDESGQLTGGYPPVVVQLSGTTEWKEYQKEYSIPQRAHQVKVQVAMGNCTGTAWFDDLSLLILDESNNPMQVTKISGPMDAGQWYPIKVNKNSTGSHYVDWSCLLDVPAGKHGFLKVTNGRFQFEDGTPAKFWGTNLVGGACFPSKSHADSLASRLSKMGCNLIRLHHMDAPWASPNIFGGSSNAVDFNAESLDQLDYLIYVLKKKGIYIFMDLLVHRDFGVIDEVENTPADFGGKQVGYFDPVIIKWQKDYARKLLTHKNSYTNLAYNEEPAIIGSEFINESSVFTHFSGDILTEPYRQELEQLFQKEYPGKKLAIFDLDYSKGIPQLAVRKNTTGDVKESIEFLSNIEQQYYREMYKTLRDLGIKYPLAGSNFPTPILTYQKNNTVNDFIITNDYWDHPQLWKMNNDWSKILYAPLNNISMLRNPQNSIIGNTIKYRWEGMPFLITEYNDCYPNEYLLEALPFVAAYASLQGYDGLLQFDFGGEALGAERINSFSLSRSPEHLAQWVVSAPLFLQSYIKAAEGLVTDEVSEEEVSSLPLYSDFLDKNYYLPYVTRVAKTFQKGSTSQPEQYSKYFSQQDKRIESETKELTLEQSKGILRINAPKVQGVVGGIGNLSIDLPCMKISVKNSWCSVIAVSKDGKDLTESNNFYVVAVGPTKMTDQKYNDSRNALVTPGELPILAQVIEGEVFFKNAKGSINITPLLPDGTRQKTFGIKGQKFDLTKGRTFVYEVEIK